MFANGSLRGPAPVNVAHLAGRYAFYDDGWPGLLTLTMGLGQELQAAYYSYRFRATFMTTAVLDPASPHHISLVIHDFNELPSQSFTGSFFTRSRNAIAGWTEWKGEPFGFFARKSVPSSLGARLAGESELEPESFAGAYSLYCDGEHATLTLAVTGPAALEGTLRETESGAAFPVTAVIDSGDRKRITISVQNVEQRSLPGQPVPTLTALLFSRQHSALAGWLAWGDTRLGCFMTRFRWEGGPRACY